MLLPCQSHGFLPFPDTTRAVTLYTPLATEEPETEVWFLLSERSFCSMVRLNHVNGTSLRWRLCSQQSSMLLKPVVNFQQQQD